MKYAAVFSNVSYTIHSWYDNADKQTAPDMIFFLLLIFGLNLTIIGSTFRVSWSVSAVLKLAPGWHASPLCVLSPSSWSSNSLWKPRLPKVSHNLEPTKAETLPFLDPTEFKKALIANALYLLLN